MKRLAILLLLIAAPLPAQDTGEDEGLFSRSIENMLRDLFSEVEPRLRELRDAIDDLNEYESPEMLPNGDIIIRRKTPLDPAPEDDPEIEIEDPEEGAVDI